MSVTIFIILSGINSLPCLGIDEKTSVKTEIAETNLTDTEQVNRGESENHLLDFMLIRNLSMKYFYTEENFHTINGNSGLNLSRKHNLFFFEDGYFSISKYFKFFYEFREYFNKNGLIRSDSIQYGNSEKYFIHRVFTEIDIYKFYLMSGIHNINSGPAQYGLILSNNTAPYLMAATGTLKPINILGEWDYTIMHAWLRENRDDWDNPKFIFTSISYSPFDFIKIGLSRFVMYGGTGEPIGGKSRPAYHSINDYYNLLNGPDENIPGGNFDNPAYSGFDISFNIPLKILISWIDSFKLYYEYSSEDMVAPWYDQGGDSSGVKFNVPAYQWGIFLKTGKHTFRIEYTAISKYFYTHHEYYEEGHSFRGTSLGHPSGRNSKTMTLSYGYSFDESIKLHSSFGIIKQPAFEKANTSIVEYYNFTELFTRAEYFRMKKYYIEISPEISIVNLKINPYFRIDFITHLDENPLPHQYTVFDENKTLFTIGLSITYRIGDFLKISI